MTRHYDPIDFDSESAPWIFLSPHLDDAAYSCGGLISRQVRDGLDVAIWTVFTASPPQRLSAFAERFHTVWGIDGDPMVWRKGEDRASCGILGASYFHLGFQDVVHRWSDAAGNWLYTSDQQVTARVHPVDAALVHDLADRLRATLPENATVVCPLAFGDHVDHQITRLAAERVGRDLAYYADYPYVRKHSLLLEPLESKAWIACSHSLDDGAVTAWQDAALAHRSQLNGNWAEGDDHLRREIANFARSKHGAALWYPPAPNRAAAGEERTRDEGLSFCILSGGTRPERLRRLVASIRRQRIPAFEIIVCGEAEQDSSYRYVEAIDEVSSGAIGAARNRAAEHAGFDHVVFCDDDIELDRDWYEGLRPYMGSWDAFATRILNPDGTRHWDWSIWQGHGRQRLLGYAEIDRDLYLTGGLMIVRTDVWSRHRWRTDLGFNQAEDVEFSQRLIAAGHRLGICTESTAVHHDDRHTQVGRGVFLRSERGISRRRDGTLQSSPKAQLLEIAAREWEHGDVANAADCIRACRARDPGSVIANELLDRLHRFHGGNVDGNDDWLMSPIRGLGG